VDLFTYAFVLALHGLINTFRVRLVAIFNDVSVWWHVIGVAVIVLALTTCPARTVPSTSSSRRTTAPAGLPVVGIYIFVVGLLLASTRSPGSTRRRT